MIPGSYECKTGNTKKYFKSKYKTRYKKKYKFFKRNKKYKPKYKGRYFYKKNDNPNNKSKFCPKGKKNCRCWICNEEGHYTNECPNRKNHHQKTIIFYQAQSIGLEPIEYEFSDLEECYILNESSESNSETSEESN